MKSHVFREYDIRGVVDRDFTSEQIYWLARAFAAYVHEKKPAARSIIVGRDGRLSSPIFHEKVVQALRDSGFAVFDTGVCPSPVVYFALHHAGYDAGIMITASHNTAEYNGLKLCLGTQSVWGSELQYLKMLYENSAMVQLDQEDSYTVVDVQSAYIASMAEQFSDIHACALSIVLDCGNGAVGSIIRQCIDALALSHVTILCEEVDGSYPNHQANPVEPENMVHVRDTVLATSADMACGFDGDGDRMAAITHDGRLIAGDHLVALFAQDILSQFPGARIVYDSKCSLIVRETILQHHGNPLMSPSGHSVIKSRMQSTGALFGGELSCHFFFQDHYFGYDDGIYAFLRLLRIVHTTGKTLAALVDQFPATYITPEIRIPCSDETKHAVVGRLAHFFKAQGLPVMMFDGLRIETEDGWGLIRASHTQPALCIRCEGRTQEGLEALQKNFYTALLQEFPLVSIEKYQPQSMEQKER